jgi:hypothetical protein
MRACALAVVIGSSLAVAAGGARSAGAQSDGTITFVTHGENSNQTHVMVQYARGKKLRIDSGDSAQSAKGSFIIDGVTGTMTILMPSQKRYMQFTTQDAAQLGAAFKPLADSMKKHFGTTTPTTPTPDQSHMSVTQGGTETVAGVSCTVYHVTGVDNNGKPGEAEICAAPGVGFFLMTAAFSGGGALGVFASRMGADPQTQARYAMLKTILSDGKGIIKLTKIENGKKTVEFEATKIDRSTPPESMFDIPAGFTKFQMPSFGGPAKPA